MKRTAPSTLPVFSAQRGQSLIEVTFATAVVSLVLVAILSSVIQSVGNSRVAIEQTQATSLAQESMEWIRNQRDVIGWGVFSSALEARGGDVTYCVPSLPATFADLITATPGECTDNEVVTDTQFQRELRLQRLSDTEVAVESMVTRPGRSGEITTRLETVLADWE
ncbi:hypothetical protein LRY65_00135 [Candidatus Woesebacteria bacterium]|nr:hypothetical protein [Candidatus Woesebacteria bacterium]MCD8526614.1 hypothetical protein [Candidatus Woesebacteria bacterium]MCD8546010.1 hypothetical protein [Candidatus Woesebacteria bacterium]